MKTICLADGRRHIPRRLLSLSEGEKKAAAREWRGGGE